MPRILSALLLLLLSAYAACAATPPSQDGPPSDESLHKLLEITNAQHLMDGMSARLDTLVQSTMQQAMKGQPVTAKQQVILDEMREKMVAAMSEELGWSKMEPLTMDIYRKSFTQGEVNDMIAFYSTPAGHAVIAKMPVVMQNTIQMMQARMGPMMQKIQAIEKETLIKLKEQEGKEPVTTHGAATGAP